MANNRCFNTSNNTIQTASDYSTALKQKTIYSNVAQNMSLIGNANPQKKNGVLYNNNFGVVPLSTNTMAGCLINSQSYDLLLNVTKGQSLYNADNGLFSNNVVNSNESWAGNLFSMNYSVKNVNVVVDTSYNAGNTNEIIYPQLISAHIADLSFNNSYPGIIVDPSYLLFYNPCLKNTWLPLVDVSFNNTNYYQTAVKNNLYYNFSYPKKVIFECEQPLITFPLVITNDYSAIYNSDYILNETFDGSQLLFDNIFDDGFGNVLVAQVKNGSNTPLNTTSYFSISFTTNKINLNLTRLQFYVGKGRTPDPRGYVIKSSVDNYTSILSNIQLPTGLPSSPVLNILSLLLNNITSITFRIYVYCPALFQSVDFKYISIYGYK